MSVRVLAAIVFVVGSLCAHAGPAQAGCARTKADNEGYVVCTYPARGSDVRTFWDDEDGNPYGAFTALDRALGARGEKLVFAMNAGMYHPDLRPVGLFVEYGAQKTRINTRRGPGNFHMLPNGVFFVTRDGAGVLDTARFQKLRPQVLFATQSGPMLVIDGKLHPAFRDDSDSRKVRNGVGVCKGEKLVFAISDGPVTFFEFARLFRDRFSCPNALFLDGSISSLYAPDINRRDLWKPMGPIIGIVEKTKK